MFISKEEIGHIYMCIKNCQERIDRLVSNSDESVQKRLEKKLAIATKALKEINKNYRFTVAQDVAYKALKEMEGMFYE